MAQLEKAGRGNRHGGAEIYKLLTLIWSGFNCTVELSLQHGMDGADGRKYVNCTCMSPKQCKYTSCDKVVTCTCTAEGSVENQGADKEDEIPDLKSLLSPLAGRIQKNLVGSMLLAEDCCNGLLQKLLSSPTESRPVPESSSWTRDPGTTIMT